MTRSTWLLLQHVDFEGPGEWLADLAERGIRLDPSCLWLADQLPEPGEIGPGRRYAGVLAMGGPMDADDDQRHPRLAAERRLLADAARRDVPVIGVCLGSQMLALGLGAELRHGANPEFGIGAVEADPAACGIDERLARAFAETGVLHWHSDVHGLPDGSQRLASTAGTPTQAFRYKRAIGMQFHVELGPVQIAAIGDRLPAEMYIDAAQLSQSQAGWSDTRRLILDSLGC